MEELKMLIEDITEKIEEIQILWQQELDEQEIKAMLDFSKEIKTKADIISKRMDNMQENYLKDLEKIQFWNNFYKSKEMNENA